MTGMRRDLVETLIGAVVLVVVLLGIVIGFASSGVSTVEGYTIKAEFDDVSGVSVGTEVRLAGVKVGTVTDKVLADNARMAILTLSIDKAAVLPADSKVRILPEGLLGGSYIVIDLLGRLVVQAASNTSQPSN